MEIKQASRTWRAAKTRGEDVIYKIATLANFFFLKKVLKSIITVA